MKKIKSTNSFSGGDPAKVIYSFDTSKAPLWATTKALGMFFSDEEAKNTLLHRLKLELSNKVLTPTAGQNNKVLNELLPIKDIIMVAALMYRYHMVGAYPFLNNFFAPTKDTLNRCIAQMIASQDGDYQYIDSLTADLDTSTAAADSSHDPWDVAEKFLLLSVQMAANTVDKTWKTDWFMPGPLTPIGIIAKILASKDSDSKDKDVPTEADAPCPEEDALLPPDEVMEAAANQPPTDATGEINYGSQPSPALDCAGKGGLYWIIQFPPDPTEELYKMPEVLGGAFGSVEGPSFKTFNLITDQYDVFKGTTSNLFYPPWSSAPGGSFIPNTWEEHCKDHGSNEGFIGSIIPLANGLNNLIGYPEGDIYPYDVSRWLKINTIPGGDPYQWIHTAGDIQIPYSFVLRDRAFFSLINCSHDSWKPYIVEKNESKMPMDTFKRVWVGKDAASAIAAILIPVKTKDTSEMLKPHGTLIDYLQKSTKMTVVDWFETAPNGLQMAPYPDWGAKPGAGAIE
jgi:hypothetical protein